MLPYQQKENFIANALCSPSGCVRTQERLCLQSNPVPASPPPWILPCIRYELLSMNPNMQEIITLLSPLIQPNTTSEPPFYQLDRRHYLDHTGVLNPSYSPVRIQEAYPVPRKWWKTSSPLSILVVIGNITTRSIMVCEVWQLSASMPQWGMTLSAKLGPLSQGHLLCRNEPSPLRLLSSWEHWDRMLGPIVCSILKSVPFPPFLLHLKSTLSLSLIF